MVVQVHAGKDLLTLLHRNSEAPLLAVDRLVNPLPITVLARRGAHVGKVALEGYNMVTDGDYNDNARTPRKQRGHGIITFNLGLEEPGLLDTGRRRDGGGEPEQIRAAGTKSFLNVLSV